MRTETPRSGAAVQWEYHRGLFPTLLSEGPEAATAAGVDGLDQMGHFGADGCKVVVDVIDEAFPPTATLDVLELGCGVGGVAGHIARHLEGRASLVGVDLVPEMCAIAGRSGLRCVAASASALAFGPASFDVVCAAGSFSHFDDPGAVVREAARICRRGGLVALLDEVGVRRGEVSAAFEAVHPAGVFRACSFDDRRHEVDGLEFDAELRDLTAWAIPTLRRRLRAVRLFRTRIAKFTGEEQRARVEATLAATLAEIERGAVVPTMVVARV